MELLGFHLVVHETTRSSITMVAMHRLIQNKNFWQNSKKKKTGGDPSAEGNPPAMVCLNFLMYSFKVHFVSIFQKNLRTEKRTVCTVCQTPYARVGHTNLPGHSTCIKVAARKFNKTQTARLRRVRNAFTICKRLTTHQQKPLVREYTLR